MGWIVHHQLAIREEIAERVTAAASRCSFKNSISEARGPEIRLERRIMKPPCLDEGKTMGKPWEDQWKTMENPSEKPSGTTP